MHFMITIDEVFLKEADWLLYQELWEPLGLPNDFRKQFEVEGEETVIVALFLGQVVGTLVLVIGPEVAEIRHTAVISDHHRSGIGRNLCQQAINYIKRKNVREIEVFARNTGIGFWEKMGFVEASDWTDHEVFAKHGIRFKKMCMKLS